MADTLIDLVYDELADRAWQIKKWWGSLPPHTRELIKVVGVAAATLAVTAAVGALLSRRSGSQADFGTGSNDSASCAGSSQVSKPSTQASAKAEPSAISPTLTQHLDAGLPVVGSRFDGKITDLAKMSRNHAIRYGYASSDGYWTDRGYDRATSHDYDSLAAASDAMAQHREALE
ncbi:hypothetical protein [Burkholderia cepacia]|uniref:hypothetical protein n=1 Tax=Burkholderia cepacia TaxID=292 RepID=UPI001CF12098|nr:hypothetical protein [Burkholderia cepacia]MCA8137819.1 hypothetical protein [Burkholderia cepacia]